MNNYYPHVLVFSNNCFSKSDSNGRTLGNFFRGWPKKCLAQFYLQNEKPDFDVCDNYCRITDKQVLYALLGKKPIGFIIKQSVETSKIDKSSTLQVNKAIKKTALSMLLRNAAWNTNLWKTKKYKNWIESFAPQLVLLQAGDCAFLIKISQTISIKYNIPLIIYNSEDYYFKKYDYFRSSGVSHILYPLFIHQFRKQFKTAQNTVKYNLYSCDALRDIYDQEFHTPSITLHTTTDIMPIINFKPNKVFTVSYLGNLGVGRHTSLIEIANALQAISTELFLDIYGNTPNIAVQNAFNNCKGIRYHGLIPYYQVIEVMQQSDLLVHAENFDAFYLEDLKFAFSTKIADSLAIGIPFLLYASERIACSKYLIKEKAAHVVTERSQLYPTLERLFYDKVYREQYISRAIQLANANHNSIKNQNRFLNIIQNVCNVENKRDLL